MKKCLISLTIVLSILLALAGCGQKKYVGTWYNIDNPDESLIITEDDTYSWKSEGGEVSEYEDGVILTEASGYGETNRIVFDSFDGETSLVTEEGYTYIKDYDKAFEYHETQVQQEIDRLSEQIVGTWKNQLYTVDMNTNGSYRVINRLSDEEQTGSWEPYRSGDYLKLSVTLDTNTFKESVFNSLDVNYR